MKGRKFPLRLILSVAAGVVTSMALSILTHLLLCAAGLFPPLHKPMFETRLLFISLAYHSLYAIGGAYITAMLARKEAKKAVFILGTKEAVMWLLGMVLLWKHSPPWFNITKAILGIPLAWLGGRFYKMKKEKGANLKYPLKKGEGVSLE